MKQKGRQTMQLVVLGLNHKTAPVEVREQFAMSKEAIRNGLRHLSEYELLDEAVVLSTCNRSEIYACVGSGEALACCDGSYEMDETLDEALAGMKQFFFDLAGCGGTEYLYHYEGEDCIRHLFEVSSSLDSLVLGEGQILSQVKHAYAIAREADSTSTVMNTLFHRAIAVGKRVRTETRIAFSPVSVSYAAVELARTKFDGNLSSSNVLIYGAGKMAELTAKHLAARGVKKIYVANRHIEKARELAEKFGGEALPLHDAMKRTANLDVVVTSTGAPHYIVHEWETRQLMRKRDGRPLVFIDIAVPRDVEPEVADIAGVTLYNIDDLENVVDENVKTREHEAVHARCIVEEEIRNIVDRFQYLAYRPLMALLSDRCEGIRAREVHRIRSKLPDLTRDEQRVITHMTQRIVRKILRIPMMKLNEFAGTADGDFYAEAMRRLFKLDVLEPYKDFTIDKSGEDSAVG